MTDADLDIFYWHLINQFWAINRVRIILINRLKRLVGKPGIGIEGLMPYFAAYVLRLITTTEEETA